MSEMKTHELKQGWKAGMPIRMPMDVRPEYEIHTKEVNGRNIFYIIDTCYNEIQLWPDFSVGDQVVGLEPKAVIAFKHINDLIEILDNERLIKSFKETISDILDLQKSRFEITSVKVQKLVKYVSEEAIKNYGIPPLNTNMDKLIKTAIHKWNTTNPDTPYDPELYMWVMGTKELEAQNDE